MKFITLATTTIILLGGHLGSSQIGAIQEWQSPAYPAESNQEHTVSITYQYTYDERLFAPPFVIAAVSPMARTFASPEATMIARASAMKDLDYDAWLATWDEHAKAEMEQRAKQSGRKLNDVVDQWRGIMKAGRIMMVRRIQTGQFVVLTYRVVDSTGKDISQLELPSVFHLVGDQWLGTQELSSDELLLESPWVSEVAHVERTVR
jgi:hypothetical protein